MAKMYLSEEETCQVLGVDPTGLMELVNSRRLQMYQDGAKHVYKASDVEALAKKTSPGTEAPEDTTELQLADGSDVDVASPPAEGAKKDDTAITAEGISIFDDEDLQIEEADPLAETQIAPSLDDQVALDGVGSGSGLLDLTRESDDTSLGAEVLDHIDMEGSALGSALGSGLGSSAGSSAGSGLGSGLGSELGSGLDTLSTAPATTTEPPAYVEAIDPAGGFFSGMLVGAAVIVLFAATAALAALMDVVSPLLEGLQANVLIVMIALVLVTLLAGGIGLFLGKAFRDEQQALQKTG